MGQQVSSTFPDVAGFQMAVVYSSEVGVKLSRELRDLLHDNDVPIGVAKWLADHNIKNVQAFTDLASDRAGIILNVARPAGLDQRKCGCLSNRQGGD